MILFEDSLISLETPLSIRIGESESRDGMAARDKLRKVPISRYSLTLHEFMATDCRLWQGVTYAIGATGNSSGCYRVSKLKIKPKFG